MNMKRTYPYMSRDVCQLLSDKYGFPYDEAIKYLDTYDAVERKPKKVKNNVEDMLSSVPEYTNGEWVKYLDNKVGQWIDARIVSKDVDEQLEPFYIIQTTNGREIGTIASRIRKLASFQKKECQTINNSELLSKKNESRSIEPSNPIEYIDVMKFKFNGITYLRDNKNILYDMHSHDAVGFYDRLRRKIMPLPDYYYE